MLGRPPTRDVFCDDAREPRCGGRRLGRRRGLDRRRLERVGREVVQGALVVREVPDELPAWLACGREAVVSERQAREGGLRRGRRRQQGAALERVVGRKPEDVEHRRGRPSTRPTGSRRRVPAKCWGARCARSAATGRSAGSGSRPRRGWRRGRGHPRSQNSSPWSDVITTSVSSQVPRCFRPSTSAPNDASVNAISAS